MEIVDTVKAKTHSMNGKAKSFGGRVRKRKQLTNEEKIESKQLFKEINKIVRDTKGRKVTEIEFKRYNGIRERLMELRVI